MGSKKKKAIEAGVELGVRAQKEGMGELEVMTGAMVAVWSLMTPAERTVRVERVAVRLRSELAAMPLEQRKAARSMLARLISELDRVLETVEV